MSNEYPGIYAYFPTEPNPQAENPIDQVGARLYVTREGYKRLTETTNYNPPHSDTMAYYGREENSAITAQIIFPVDAGRVVYGTPLSVYQFMENPSPERRNGISSSYSFWYEATDRMTDDDPQLLVPRGVRQTISFDNLPERYGQVSDVSLMREVTDQHGVVERGRLTLRDDTALKQRFGYQDITAPMHIELWNVPGQSDNWWAFVADIGPNGRAAVLEVLDADQLDILSKAYKIGGLLSSNRSATSLNVMIGKTIIGLTVDKFPQPEFVKNMLSDKPQQLTPATYVITKF